MTWTTRSHVRPVGPATPTRTTASSTLPWRSTPPTGGPATPSTGWHWRDKETLLVDAVHARADAPEVDTGTLEGDLLAVYSWLLQHFLTEAGWVAVRIAVDGAAEDATWAAPERVGAQHAMVLNQLWARATARGEIPGPDDSRVRIATRMMYGDLLLRAMVDRPQLAALDEAGRAEESRFVVAMLLRMLGR